MKNIFLKLTVPFLIFSFISFNASPALVAFAGNNGGDNSGQNNSDNNHGSNDSNNQNNNNGNQGDNGHSDKSDKSDNSHGSNNDGNNQGDNSHNNGSDHGNNQGGDDNDNKGDNSDHNSNDNKGDKGDKDKGDHNNGDNNGHDGNGGNQSTPSVTTNPATGVTDTTATLNGTNGPIAADNSAFWYGTTSVASFTSSANPGGQLPGTWSGVYVNSTNPTPQLANAPFNYALTGLTPSTQYYFVAWSEVGGIWYPGSVLSATTTSGTNGGGGGGNPSVCDASVNLIQNGGFENPTINTGHSAVIPDVTVDSNSVLKWLVAWTYPETTGTLGLEIQNHIAGDPDVNSGNQFAELDGDHPTIISQVVPTIIGDTYDLSFDYSARPNTSAIENQITVKANNNTLGALLEDDGSLLSNTSWHTQTRSFVATSSSTTVSFADTGSDTSLGGYLDNVSLNCNPNPNNQSTPSVTTNPATSITDTTATLNGTNGPIAADNSAFWYGTTSVASFTSSANPGGQLPGTWSGVYVNSTNPTPQLANAPFNYALTGLTPSTQYYFVAWSEVGGIWYPGSVLSATTTSGTNGGGGGNTCDASSLLTGLVSYWPLNESSGSTASDVSAGGNNGTNYSITSTSGKLVGSYSFNGSNSYVDIGNKSNLSLSSTGSISTWIYPTDVTHMGMIVSKGNPGSDLNGYTLGFNYNTLYWELASSSAHIDGGIPLSGNISNNNWYLVTLAWDGSHVNLYLNGNLVSTTPQTLTPSSGTYPFRIGARGDYLGSGLFKGNIDEVGVWNRALSQTEVTKLYNTTDGISWPFYSCSTPSVTTNPATGVTDTTATLNGTNGSTAATNTSFWYGTTSSGPFTPMVDPSSEFPVGWTHDAGLGTASANATFNEPLTGLTPSTQYYFVAWSEVGGIWYPGSVLSATTTSGTNGGGGGGGGNQSPTANAGPDQTITLPTNSVTLSGSGTDPDGTIASYAWTGTGGTITSPTSASTTVTGLSVGTYTYTLTVTDNGGATGTDTVVITVNPHVEYSYTSGGGYAHGSNGGGGSNGGNGGRVLGASTTCGIYIPNKFLRQGYDNDAVGVRKLQVFLNKYANAGLDITGYFDQSTENAVKAFQLANADKVLKPWGLKAPTGIFYLTTQTEVNNIMCPELKLPIPSLVPLILSPFITNKL